MRALAKYKLKILIAILPFMLLLLGCESYWQGPTLTPEPTPRPTRTPVPDDFANLAREQLASAWAMWKANGSDDYDILYLSSWTGRVQLQVRDGEIDKAHLGEQVPEYAWRFVHDVEGLFWLVDRHIGKSPKEFTVHYHPVYGFPTYVSPYRDSGAIDAGFQADLQLYRPLEPKPKPDPPPRHPATPNPVPAAGDASK